MKKAWKWLQRHEARITFESRQQLDEYLKTSADLANCLFHKLDLRRYTKHLLTGSLKGCQFLGCELTIRADRHAVRCEAMVYPPYFPEPYWTQQLASYTRELFSQTRPGAFPEHNRENCS